jgi:hypothetical protein
MRLAYIFAVAAGQEPSLIFATIAVGSKHAVKLADTQRLVFDGQEFITRKLVAGASYTKTQSTATNGTWDIYGCLPIIDDEKAAKDFWKALNKAQKDKANKVGIRQHMLGPWTVKALDKLAWVADRLCYEQEPDSYDAESKPSLMTHKKPGAPLQLPWVIVGDNPVQLASQDYGGE